MLVGYDPMSCVKPEGYARALDRAAVNSGAAPDPAVWKAPVNGAASAPVANAAAGADPLPPMTTGYCSGWGSIPPQIAWGMAHGIWTGCVAP